MKLTHRSGEIAEFTAEDYSMICAAYLDAESAARIDYTKVHRFAPALNGHQLKNSCRAMRKEDGIDTESFIAYLNSQNMISNVDLAEVQPVDWSHLKGVDDGRYRALIDTLGLRR